MIEEEVKETLAEYAAAKRHLREVKEGTVVVLWARDREEAISDAMGGVGNAAEAAADALDRNIAFLSSYMRDDRDEYSMDAAADQLQRDRNIRETLRREEGV